MSLYLGLAGLPYGSSLPYGAPNAATVRMVTHELYPAMEPMTFRSFLLMVHDKWCRPWLVPVVSRITKVAGIIAAIAWIYALVASQ